MKTTALTKALDKTKLTREKRSTKNANPVVTYYNKTKKDYKVKVNGTATYNKVIQICIKGDYIYINHLKRHTLKKLRIANITSITVSAMT